MAKHIAPSIRLQVTNTAQVNDALGQLSMAIRRRLNRYAVAAAARPMLAGAKVVARQIAMQSKRHEGLGTTSRAMELKVASLKANPDVAYAIIGVERHYSEFANLLLGGSGGKRATVRSIDVIRKNRKVKFRTLTNIGPIARKARLDPASNSSRRRRPVKYARLLERGTRRSMAYPIIKRAQFQQQYMSVGAFRVNFVAGLNREIARLARRKTGLAA